MSVDHQEEQSDSETSEGYRIVQRSQLTSIVLVAVVTFSMLINVRALLWQIFDLLFLNPLQVSNNTAVSISLPTIGREFNADPSLLQWIVSVYPLSSVSKRRPCGVFSGPMIHVVF